ncbi:hypothetical protein V2J09_024071 [Rumex salicifolius]
MASEQQKLKRMEKPGLGYGQFAASPLNGKPFSIREYALMSRQRNIEQSWPFSQKYLKLCLDNGITNILPPFETRRTILDGLHGRLAVDSGKNSRTKLFETEKKSRPVKYPSLKDTISLLCEKLGRLSLSCNGGALVGQKRGLVAKSDSQISNNVQSFKAQTSFRESNCEKGRRRKRKTKTKTKSMVEIMAVAKHCILKGNDRIIVSGCTSTAFHEQNADEKRKKDFKGVSSVTSSRSIEPNDGFSSTKKRRRCNDDYVPGISQCNQRSRSSMDAINYKNDVGCKFESRSRKPSSCRTAEIEKKPGGFERKALKTHPIQISVVELQDHNAC